MWILVKFVVTWLIGLAWKAFWKKPMSWGTKIKNLFPIISKIIIWRRRKPPTPQEPTPQEPTPQEPGQNDSESTEVDTSPGWRIRRLFKRLR